MTKNNSIIRKKVKSISITVAGVAAVVGIILGILNLGITVYRMRYDKNVDSGATINMTFKSASGARSQAFNIAPSKGNMYYSLMQSKGNDKMKYTLAYKKTTASSYTNIAKDMTFAKNNVYRTEKKITSVNGKTKYNGKLTKTAGTSTESKISMDWLLK